MLKPEEVKHIILSIDPKARVNITSQGFIPPSIPRFSVETHLFGADVRLNLGENLVLFIDGTPRAVSMYLPLQDPDQTKKQVNEWLNKVDRYLESKEVPLVKHLAEVALGKELKIVKKPNSIWVYYDLFTVIITPELAVITLNSTGRVVLSEEFTNNKGLQKFFSTGHFTAESIRKGQIR
ncbi:MAG: hypothetical protein V1702_03850 [Candidatus Woesearchaeota archaeon]